MQHAKESLGGFVEEYVSGDARKTLFYTFEPWDVGERAGWIGDQIKKDGVGDKVDSYDTAPHLFQSGIVYEYPRIAAIFAVDSGTSTPLICWGVPLIPGRSDVIAIAKCRLNSQGW